MLIVFWSLLPEGVERHMRGIKLKYGRLSLVVHHFIASGTDYSLCKVGTSCLKTWECLSWWNSSYLSMLKGNVFLFLEKPAISSRGKPNRINAMSLLRIPVKSLVQDLLSRKVVKCWRGVGRVLWNRSLVNLSFLLNIKEDWTGSFIQDAGTWGPVLLSITFWSKFSCWWEVVRSTSWKWNLGKFKYEVQF